MHIAKPVFKNEFNVTTVVALVGLASVLGGWVWTASSTTSELRTWQVNHEQLHKDRNVTISSDQARTDQRLTGLEADSRKIENLAYRVTVQEQGSANLAKSVEELKNTVNGQSADIRVMLEILKRQDSGQNGK